MKTLKKNVYYCDFCKKHGMSAGHMAKHEKHCTGNPNRECRVCKEPIEIGEEAKKLRARFKFVDDDVFGRPESVSIKVEWIDKEITMDEIDEIIQECPVCKLALMRQSELTHFVFSNTALKFDYKKALDTYWAERNIDEGRVDEQSYQY